MTNILYYSQITYTVSTGAAGGETPVSTGPTALPTVPSSHFGNFGVNRHRANGGSIRHFPKMLEYLSNNTTFTPATDCVVSTNTSMDYSGCLGPVTDQMQSGTCWIHGATQVASFRAGLLPKPEVNREWATFAMMPASACMDGAFGGFAVELFSWAQEFGFWQAPNSSEYTSGFTPYLLAMGQFLPYSRDNTGVTSAAYNTIHESSSQTIQSGGELGTCAANIKHAEKLQQDLHLLRVLPSHIGKVQILEPSLNGELYVHYPSDVRKALDRVGPLAIGVASGSFPRDFVTSATKVSGKGPIFAATAPQGNCQTQSFTPYGYAFSPGPELQSGSNCGIDHDIMVVGYGEEEILASRSTTFNPQQMRDTSGEVAKIPYFILRNSWGPWWGEQGYIRVYEPALFTDDVPSGVNDGRGAFNFLTSTIATIDIHY